MLRPQDKPTFKDDGSTYIGQLYDSMSDFMVAIEPDYTIGGPKNERSSMREEKESKDGYMGWTGTRNYAEAVELAKHGWPEGLKGIEVMRQSLEKRIDAYIPNRRADYDVAGSMFDMGAFIRGEPESAIHWELTEQQRKSVDISIDIAASAGVSTKVMLARGALIAGLTYALERLSVPTRVTVMGSMKGHEPNLWDGVIVKHEGAMLDIERLAFTTAHPAMFRRLWFSLWENYPRDIRESHGIHKYGGYGYPGNTPKRLRSEVHLESAMYGDSRWLDQKNAEGWIMDRLLKLGVVIQ